MLSNWWPPCGQSALYFSFITAFLFFSLFTFLLSLSSFRVICNHVTRNYEQEIVSIYTTHERFVGLEQQRKCSVNILSCSHRSSEHWCMSIVSFMMTLWWLPMRLVSMSRLCDPCTVCHWAVWPPWPTWSVSSMIIWLVCRQDHRHHHDVLDHCIKK